MGKVISREVGESPFSVVNYEFMKRFVGAEKVEGPANHQEGNHSYVFDVYHIEPYGVTLHIMRYKYKDKEESKEETTVTLHGNSKSIGEFEKKLIDSLKEFETAKKEVEAAQSRLEKLKFS